jgi:dTMP kinase
LTPNSPRPKKLSGRFITFEGGEGAGKSTQIRLLAGDLAKRGLEVVLTREPGGSPGAEAIRALLVEGEPGRWDGVTETLLFAAARRDHVECTIRPALEQGSWVLCDRFMDSTIAYQGYGAGVDIALVRRLSADAAGDIVPDLTLILDLPVEAGLARAAGRAGGEDRFERKGIDFHTRLREGFLAIAQAEPNRCVVIDATAARDVVAQKISKIVSERLKSLA